MTLEIVQTVPTTNVNEGGESIPAKEEQQAAKRKQPAPPPPKPAPSSPDSPSKPSLRAPDPTVEIIPEKPQKKRKLAEIQLPAPPKSKPQRAAAEKMPKKLPKPPPKRINKMVQQNELVKKRTDALTGVMQNLAKARVVNEDAEKKRREQERKIAADKLNDSVSAAAGDV